MSFDLMRTAKEMDFGDVHLKVDPHTGLTSIVAIHNTHLGPALGGCRLQPYDNFDEAAFDVMRLARGMSYKSALAGLPLGGGKAVIIKPEQDFDREALFKSFGRFLNELDGRYITAMDMGVDVPDMDIVATQSRYVSCTSKHKDNGPSDPSSYTAAGTLRGIEAACQMHFGTPNLSGRHIAIQGLGHVGRRLAHLCHEQGAKLTVCDINPGVVEAVKVAHDAQVCTVEDFCALDCDVLAPCARGAILNDTTIPQIKAPIVAGAANNQLLDEDKHGQALQDRGIVYAPDFVINAGGIILVAYQYLDKDIQAAREQVQAIYDTTLEILTGAKRQNCAPHQAALQIAKERLSA